jgi:hypothetical protein
MTFFPADTLAVLEVDAGLSGRSLRRNSDIDGCHGGVIPEQTVAVTGEDHRNTDFAILLKKLNGVASIVPDGLLMLTQTIDAFIGLEFEGLANECSLNAGYYGW